MSFKNINSINASQAEANDKLTALLDMPGGLEKIASDVLPDLIRTTRDYVGFSRKVLTVDPVSKDDVHKTEKGEFYVQYPKDIGAAATYFGEEFETPDYKITGDVVNVPILTIASEESRIDMKRLLVEKIDYLERARDLAGQAIAQLEDYRVMMLVERLIQGDSVDPVVPQHGDQVVITAETTLSKAHLVGLKKTQSRHDLNTEAFVLNMATLDDILAWDDNDLDQTTRRELLETGVRYTLWGTVALIPSRLIPLNTVYSFSEKGYTGVIPELNQLTPMLVNTDNRLIKGVFLYEYVGFALFNEKAVGKLITGFTGGDAKIVDYADKIRVKVQG